MDGLEWGPPYYPESSGRVGGFRSRFERGNREGGGGGSWQLTSLGARLWVTGLKEGSRPHAGKVRSRKPIFSTALPLNIPV